MPTFVPCSTTEVISEDGDVFVKAGELHGVLYFRCQVEGCQAMVKIATGQTDGLPFGVHCHDKSSGEVSGASQTIEAESRGESNARSAMITVLEDAENHGNRVFEFDSAKTPTLIEVAKEIAREMNFELEKRVTVLVQKFDDRFKSFVVVNASGRIEDAAKYEMKYSIDSKNRSVTVVQEGRAPNLSEPEKTTNDGRKPDEENFALKRLQNEARIAAQEAKCGRALFCASFDKSAFKKVVEFDARAPKSLLEVISEIFYEDTEWNARSCFVTAEKKDADFGEFTFVAADYGAARCEDKAEYAIRFVEVAAAARNSLPKFARRMEGAAEEEEPREEPRQEETFADAPEPDVEVKAINFVKFTGYCHEISEEPKKKVVLELACPKNCSAEAREWSCVECESPVFFTFGENLVCSCGAHQRMQISFKCAHTSHGNTFVQCDRTTLQQAFKNMGDCQDINVVLLGETGAGKSTWINGIFNYRIRENFDAAIAANATLYPIPTHFLLEDDDGEIRAIHMGEASENERLEAGHSATQKPKTYTFMHRNNLVRFVDVPGIGDTEGPPQDRANFEMIMNELHHYEKIHAICILIPNDAPRLTVSLRYCINELLTHLHQSAAKNIVFCFTKARSNFYRAGNTQRLLSDYLSTFRKDRNVDIKLNKDTMYYFDNEALKYLCALEHGLSMDAQRQDFERSWDVSAQSTKRVLDHILSIEPHAVREMISLNEAKRLILQLTPISAEITKNIQMNKRIVEAKKVELEQMEQQTVDMKSQLTIEQATLKATPLDYPRTACAAASCIETLAIPGTAESQTLYKTLCHDPCYLTGVEEGRYPNPDLQHCAAMNSSLSCDHCGCSWDMHLHIRYLQEQQMVTVDNEEVMRLIGSRNDDQVAVADVIQGLESKLEDLQRKEDRIKTICANFVAFLHANAIAVVNDAYGEYLEYAITLAKDEATHAPSATATKKVEQLQRYLDEYKEEVKLLKVDIKSGAKDITADNIDAMKRELLQMGDLGDQFKSFIDAINKSEKTYQRETEVHLPTHPPLVTANGKQKRKNKKNDENEGGSGAFYSLKKSISKYNPFVLLDLTCADPDPNLLPH